MTLWPWAFSRRGAIIALVVMYAAVAMSALYALR